MSEDKNENSPINMDFHSMHYIVRIPRIHDEDGNVRGLTPEEEKELDEKIKKFDNGN